MFAILMETAQNANLVCSLRQSSTKRLCWQEASTKSSSVNLATSKIVEPVQRSKKTKVHC